MFIYSEKNIIKKIRAKNIKGFNRVSWNLLSESKSVISSKNLNENNEGYMANPGEYSAQLFKQVEGKFISISEKILFNVKQLTESSIKGSSITEISEFKDELYDLKENANNLYDNIEDLNTKINIMLKAYERAASLDKKLHDLLLNNRNKVLDLQKKLGGSQVRKEIGEENEYPTMWSYLWAANSGANTTYGPTKSHKKSLNIANQILLDIEMNYKKIKKTINPLKDQLKKIGAPKIKN